MNANEITMRVKRLHPDAIIPQYATDGAACIDLSALATTGIPIKPDEPVRDWSYRIAPNTALAFRTGLAVEVPPGYALMIYSRSGHGFKNSVRLANAVGVIDSDYRGELLVRLINDDPRMPFEVKKGDRIAQAMLVLVPRMALVEADELGDTARGAGGFGSTGA